MKSFGIFLFLVFNFINGLSAHDDLCSKSNCMHRRQTQFNDKNALIWSKKNTEIPTKYWKLIHTDLDIEPIWKTKQLKGTAVLRIHPYFYEQREIVLDAQKMDIHSIEVIHKKANVFSSFNYDSTKLKITLSKVFKQKDTLLVKIKYTSNPERIKSKGGSAISSDKGLYFINTDSSKKDVPVHLWTQGEPEANSCWFPTFDHPSVKHSQRIKVTYPNHFTSLSNGKRISSVKNANKTTTDIWEQKMPHAVYLSALIIGDYKIVTDKWKNIDVNYYMEPKYENVARPIFGRTPQMITYFSNLLDYPFPWEKYSQVIVHEYVSGAMENTSAVTFNTGFQKDLRELYDANDDETIAHELFHHWFGDVTNCESWTHLTLNESFANYSEYLWYDYFYGHDRAQLHWYNDLQAYFYQSKVKRDPLVRTEYTTPDDVFDVITYNKGGKILHMLRTILGDDAFFKSLSHYLKKHAYKTAEYSDFRKACEEVTGLDLEWFFNQWYLKGGHPIITTEWKQNGNEVMLYLSQKHNFDSTFIYRIPMDLDMYAENNVIRKNIVLEKSKDTFVFILNEKVKAINFDASNVLVAQKKDKKTTEENIYLLKNAPNFLDQYYAIQRLKEEVEKEDVLAAISDALDSKKSEIQTLAIQLLEKEHFEKLNQLENKLVTIANGKKNSEARAAAILKLDEANRIKNHISLIENCLKDSSYIVEAAAIKGLNSIDSTRALDLAKNRLESKNTDLRFAAIEIVSNTNDTNYLNYFKKNLETKRGTDKILAGIGFSKMIANTDAQNWTKSIQFLDTFFENPKNRKMYLANYIANGIITKLDKNKSEVNGNRKLEIQKKYLVWTKSNENKNVDEENEDAEE